MGRSVASEILSGMDYRPPNRHTRSSLRASRSVYEPADRQRAMAFYIHVAIATAVFAIAGIDVLPKPVATAIGLVVALLGMTLFRLQTHPLLWLFPLAMLLTALWSPDPAFTAISVGAIVVPVLLAGAVVSVCGPARFIQTLAEWSRIALILSFLLFLFIPDMGAQHDALYDGAMRGLFEHKNGLARILVIGVFAEVFTVQRARKRLLWLGAYVGAGMLARSLSFFVLAALIIALFAVLRQVDWRNPRSVGLFVGFGTPAMGIAITVAVLAGPGILADTGRFSVEDDRGRIWQGALTLFQMKPLGGWGYGEAFHPGTEASAILYSVSGWVPPEAHGGYMNALAEAGWLGVLALGITLLGAVVFTWRARSTLTWPVVFAVCLVLNNLTDTRTASIEWFILAAAVLYATEHRRADRPRVLESTIEARAL